MHIATLYEKLSDSKVKCNLCSHRCVIADSRLGVCGVRENKDGILYTLVYGKAISGNVDPIEKKPLFHFYPGTGSYSVATVGCNFRCLHCQNHDISQLPRNEHQILGENIAPEDIVHQALRYGCKSIAYTYTEPTVFFEYAYDTVKLANKEGLKNVFVTNGYMTEEALNMINPYLDAANVDLKAFTDEHYHKICGAHLDPVLDRLRQMKELGIWVEVTTLVIPTLNDSEDELQQIAEFVHSLGPETPWHVSRYYPAYKMQDLPQTPIETLNKARQIGLKVGLRYVYSGNVPGADGEHTFCYSCKKLLIQRYGFRILKNELRDSNCAYCAAEIDGIGL